MAVKKHSGKRGTRYWIDLRLEGGQRIRRAFRNAEEAKAAYHEELARRARGETPLLVKSKRTFAEAAAKYLQTGQWSPRERERVEGIYRIYLTPRFGARELASITRLDVEEYRRFRQGQVEEERARREASRGQDHTDASSKIGRPPKGAR